MTDPVVGTLDPVSAPAIWQLLAQANYVSLTTFRKDGTPVATPVWIAPDGDRLLVWTNPEAGKVKRIRRNADVTVAPCTMRGAVVGGGPVPARATVLPDSEVPTVRRALIAKYGWQARLTFLPQHLVAAIGRPHPAGVLEITLDADPVDSGERTAE